ncbi:MAG: aminopeptidase P family protein [Clostridiales bacterium]|nr:aminopeptidase P family protein [Clostridiales bacterium]
MNRIAARIEALRAKMREAGYAAYYIPTDDFHLSEYVGDHFKCRAYLSGFTGSAGVLIVTLRQAGLWVDGRYFIQGEEQLKGTPITLYKMGEEGVPTTLEFLKQNLTAGDVLGFDGRTVPTSFGKLCTESLGKLGVRLDPGRDLVDAVWEGRPPLSENPAWVLSDAYAGESVKEKLRRLREAMAEQGVKAHVLASLMDVAWLYNLRGSDVACTPVVLSYAVIEQEEACLFINEKKLDETVRAHLRENGITVLPYEAVYGFLSRYGGEKVLLSESDLNFALYAKLQEAGARIVNAPNPTALMKAVKNETELSNTREAHLKDAVTMVRFMKWLKENIGKAPLTELEAAKKLDAMRLAGEGCLDLSFTTICGYGPHGAIVHYSVTAESDIPLAPRGLLLVDSGGQYDGGTTDITRTFALGPLTEEEKRHFAITLKSMLALQNARFLYGTTGAALDMLARQPFWAEGLDFKHGTGHGVGYLLSVHEGPNSFRHNGKNSAVLEEGMVTTDEPGIYIAGSHGIRLENELVCRKGEKNGYGQFMYFEPLTFVPLDLDAVDAGLLSPEDKARLNAYHAAVYEALAPRLDEEERDWLKAYTRAV